MDYYWGETVNYCTDLMCGLDEEFKHQIEDSEEQDLAEIAQMLKAFQREMSIGRVACTHYAFLLGQKLGLLNSMINSENFAHLNRALADVHNFLLMKEEEE